MPPKKAGVKKLKAVAGAATATKKSPDKLRAKVAEAKAEEEEEEEPDLDHLLSYFNKKEEPVIAPAPAPEPAPAATSAEGIEPGTSPFAPEAASSSSMTAAGSALNAKRLLDSGAGPSTGLEVPPITVAGDGALAEALGIVNQKEAARASGGPSAAVMPAADTAKAPAAPVPDDVMLLEALKKARKKVADQHNLMTNMVCATEMLEAVARLKPITVAALAEVDDFGPTRAARYGEPLLECIRAHIDAVVATGGDAAPGSGHGTATDAPSAEGDATATAATVSGGGGGGGGHVTVRYNHYSEEFTLSADGKLDFRLVDDKYALTYVFKGKPRIRLQRLASGAAAGGALAPATVKGDEIWPDGGALLFPEGRAPAANGLAGAQAVSGTFSGLSAGAQYLVVVDEDPKERAKMAAANAAGSKGGMGSKSGGGFGRAVGGGTRGSALITAELKKLSAEELREAGPKYRALLEARDLEDAMGGETEVDSAILGEDSSGCSCLYGNPCAMPHACKNWKDRFEIAKKNGWKGF